MKNLFATAASVLVLGLASSAMAQSNYSDVQQIGSDHTATIEQVGSTAANVSVVKQGLKPGWSDNNKATVTQTGTGYIDNTSVINQDGDDNQATVTQKGDGWDGGYNLSTLTQDGDDNKATITQDGNGVYANTSLLTQDGNRNQANVNQYGGTLWSNYSTITQQGHENTATVTQR